MKVVDDSGRPKFQVQFKGETKSFFPEEVSPFGQLASSSVSQSTNQSTRLYGLDTRDKPSPKLPGQANQLFTYFLEKFNQPFTRLGKYNSAGRQDNFSLSVETLNDNSGRDYCLFMSRF